MPFHSVKDKCNFLKQPRETLFSSTFAHLAQNLFACPQSKAFFTFFGSTQRHNVTDRLTDVVSDSCSASASASVRCSASASATAIAIDMVNSFWSDEKNENENENENELNKRNEMRSH